MFGFLMGMVLGAIGGAAYGSRYFRDSDLQTQFNDTQDRLTNLTAEVRTVLDETRTELRQAWERTRDSAVEKAERIQTVIGESGAGAGSDTQSGGSGSGGSTSGGGASGGSSSGGSTSGGGASGGGASKSSSGSSPASKSSGSTPS
ncbi:MAG TPA: hypothetical protein VNM48_21155 [Chloroflexota bacterium]|nr:hypothetical protein [Chloroflexota bacterium]